VCRDLEDMAEAKYGSGAINPVIRAALSGIAAYNFKGCTLHTLFRLPIHFTRDY
jgi:hypothetical protein